MPVPQGSAASGLCATGSLLRGCRAIRCIRACSPHIHTSPCPLEPFWLQPYQEHQARAKRVRWGERKRLFACCALVHTYTVLNIVYGLV